MTKMECAAIIVEAIKMDYLGYTVTAEFEDSGRYCEVYPAHVAMTMEATGDIDLEFGLDITDHCGDIMSNVTLKSLTLQE